MLRPILLSVACLLPAVVLAAQDLYGESDQDFILEGSPIDEMNGLYKVRERCLNRQCDRCKSDLDVIKWGAPPPRSNRNGYHFDQGQSNDTGLFIVSPDENRLCQFTPQGWKAIDTRRLGHAESIVTKVQGWVTL